MCPPSSRSIGAATPSDDSGPDDAPEIGTGTSARVLVVRDPAAARYLVRPSGLRQLGPFLGTARSVGEAAALTREKPNTVLRRVTRLQRLGLLEVAETVPRRGRALRRYRTTAEVYFVPFDATGAESLEAAIAERDAHLERLLRRNVVRARIEAMGSWGTRVYRDHRGRIQVQTAVSPDANATLLDDGQPAALSAWRDQVHLDYHEAKAFQRELFQLVLRYQRASGAQRYVVHVGLAPVLTDA